MTRLRECMGQGWRGESAERQTGQALVQQALAEEYGIHSESTWELLLVSRREITLPNMESKTKRTSGRKRDGKD